MIKKEPQWLVDKYGARMAIIKVLASVSIIVSLWGCAHPIEISPNQENLERGLHSTQPIKAKVALFIPTQALDLEVTTPGGGGDNVRYYPYKALEAGYQRMLQNVFESVTRVQSLEDSNALTRNGFSFTLTPELITNSGSTGLFTWPPTNFSVDLTTKIRDANGILLDSPRVIGIGQATGYSDFSDDYGIAGRRAMEDALVKTQGALREAKYNTSVVAAPPLPPTHGNQITTGINSTASSTLQKARELLDKGLITKEEYERKKKEVLDNL
jgi:hypothetical protein